MRIAYFDCFSGISGDMILGALVDAGLQVKALRQELAKLSLPGWELRAQRTERGGISATQVEVAVAHQEGERGLSEILEILARSQIDAQVLNKAKGIFSRLAEAEAKIHGIQPQEVHFHEVGAMDAIVDVVGSVIGLKLLGIHRVYSSALRVGSGFLHCRHGNLPVPAPATLELLRDVPIVISDMEGELVTPTGAAIITELAESFHHRPSLGLERIGYGAGKRDLEQVPNVLRILIGQTEGEVENDQVMVLETNLDDMSPELCGPLLEVLLREGALDAYLTPVIMKKGRPAVVLTVLASEEKRSALADMIFRHTTTLGLRTHLVYRDKLPREIQRVETRWGSVQVKVARIEGRKRMAPEFEDCLRLAREQGVPLWEVYQEVRKSWETTNAENS